MTGPPWGSLQRARSLLRRHPARWPQILAPEALRCQQLLVLSAGPAKPLPCTSMTRVDALQGWSCV